MTQEEKARAYDEAIKVARSKIKNGKDHILYEEDITDIFPELKESEDERSKKWILEYLYDGLRKSDEQFKEQFKCAIAWLEKQGARNPAAWGEEDENRFSNLIYLVKCSGENEATKKGFIDFINSLKSFRQRIGG